MHFVKMHGLGNDYIFVDCFREEPPADPAALSAAVSDRHFGIGADGLILILPSDAADARMRMFNADGSEGRMCGNGVRCVGKYLYDSGLCRRERITVETPAGIRELRMIVENGAATGARVDMGVPALDGPEFPPRPEGSDPAKPMRVRAAGYDLSCVSFGNLHAVCLDGIPGEAVRRADGPRLERAALFPERANIEWVEVRSRHRLRMRVWERGSGETMACGTGASAAAVAAISRGLCESPVTVELPAGELLIEWEGPGRSAFMTGPAEAVFRGEWPFPKYAP